MGRMASRNGRIPLGPLAADVAAQAMLPSGRAGRVIPFSPGPPPPVESDASGPPELQEALYLLITQQWVQTLTGPYDWGNWPLGRYVFGEKFLRDTRRPSDIENAAWVCAMVACGLAHEFAELEDQPRTAGPGDGQFARADGAVAYRCTIVTGRGAGSHLDYWRLPSGVMEFDRFSAIRLLRSPPTN
jgi:hypothetical protein